MSAAAAGRATQALLLLRGSKTDQCQCGKTLVLAAADGSAVDPIVVLRALLQALPAGVDGSSPLMTLWQRPAAVTGSADQS